MVVKLNQSLPLAAFEEITNEKLKEIINSNHFRYFILNEGRLLLVKLKS